MLNTALNKGQFTQVVGLMQKEAQFRLDSQKDTINQLQKDLSNVGNLVQQAATATSTQSYQINYQGKIYNVDAQGNMTLAQ